MGEGVDHDRPAVKLPGTQIFGNNFPTPAVFSGGDDGRIPEADPIEGAELHRPPHKGGSLGHNHKTLQNRKLSQDDILALRQFPKSHIRVFLENLRGDDTGAGSQGIGNDLQRDPLLLGIP